MPRRMRAPAAWSSRRCRLARCTSVGSTALRRPNSSSSSSSHALCRHQGVSVQANNNRGRASDAPVSLVCALPRGILLRSSARVVVLLVQLHDAWRHGGPNRGFAAPQVRTLGVPQALEEQPHKESMRLRACGVSAVGAPYATSRGRGTPQLPAETAARGTTAASLHTTSVRCVAVRAASERQPTSPSGMLWGGHCLRLWCTCVLPRARASP